MEYRNLSEEPGKMRCSDLEVPVFTSEDFEPVVTSYLNFITNDQWKLLAAGQADTDTTLLLSDMCHEILDAISCWVLEAVGPQVQSRMYGQEGATYSINTSFTMNMTETSHRKRNYHSVTEDDILASLGDSLYNCFGEALGLEQDMPQVSGMLTQLFAEEVKKRVNCSLAIIKQLTSSPQSMGSIESETTNDCLTEDLVYNVIQITGCLIKRDEQELSNDEESLDSDFSTSPSPDEVTEVEEFSSNETEIIYFDLKKHKSDLLGGQSVKHFDSYAEQLQQRSKTFHAVFLGKLLDHIAESTETSILDVDFDRMLGYLRERTVGEISSILPKRVGNIHIPIFEEVCCELGCSKLLQAAMVSGNVAFEEAVAVALIAQLQKPSRNTSSFITKVRRFFSRNKKKIAPVCEINILVSHTEVISRENGSTLTPMPTPTRKEQKPSAIMKMFSSVARILRKSFTFCN